jgi:type II secretory pathway component PulJ
MTMNEIGMLIVMVIASLAFLVTFAGLQRVGWQNTVLQERITQLERENIWRRLRNAEDVLQRATQHHRELEPRYAIRFEGGFFMLDFERKNVNGELLKARFAIAEHSTFANPDIFTEAADTVVRRVIAATMDTTRNLPK